MTIDYPETCRYVSLWQLWQEAFQDDDTFLNGFFRTAFSPLRCRCALREDRVAGALYWLDCVCGGQKLAYLYAVATHPDFRGQGVCRALMADAHALLAARGYDGVLLVPDGERLRGMYAAMGYQEVTALSEFVCAAGADPVAMHAIDAEEYARCRRELLPPDSVLQEGESLRFLDSYAQFYTGLGFLLAARPEGELLRGLEILGDPEAAPGILRTLGFSQGIFRAPGAKQPFAMFRSLTPDAECPAYFAFAFD